MEKIDKEYAIVYIDWDGATLREKNYATDEIISDYYSNPERSFLAWNQYIIIPLDLVGSFEEVEKIQAEQKYTRKYVIERGDIKTFIEDRFPDLTEDVGTVTLVKGRNWEDAVIKAHEERYKSPSGILRASFYRDDSSMDTLTYLDEMRAFMIRHPSANHIFFTHLSDEYFWAKKKLGFLKDKNIKPWKKESESGSKAS